MTTAPVSPKPDEQRADQPARHEPQGAQPEQPALRLGSDRDVDADLLLDMPQLSVEQLTLELDASILLRNVKLDAKGLDAGLYLKADLDLVKALVLKQSGEVQERPSRQSKGGDTGPVQGLLRDLVGATRDAYRDLSARTSEHGQLTGSERSALEHRPERSSSDEQDGRAHAALERARDVAAGGAKAAGLTAAGIAGGAILESRMKSSRKLPLPRRRNKAQAIGHQITKRLP